MNKFIHKFSLNFIIVGILAAVIFQLNGCSETDIPENKDTGLNITGISIPASLDVSKNNAITISGNGFETGDKILFTSLADMSKEFITEIASVTDQSATFNLPADITTGNYKITV